MDARQHQSSSWHSFAPSSSSVAYQITDFRLFSGARTAPGVTPSQYNTMCQSAPHSLYTSASTCRKCGQHSHKYGKRSCKVRTCHCRGGPLLRARVCSTTPTSCAAASACLFSTWRELARSSSEGSFLTRPRMRLSAASETPVMLDSTRNDLFMQNARTCKRAHRTLSKMAASKHMRASPCRCGRHRGCGRHR